MTVVAATAFNRTAFIRWVWPAAPWGMTQASQGAQTDDVYSDESLISSILNCGSQQHYRILVSRHKSRVHQVVLSVLGPANSADAEDVAQEVFIRAFSKLDSFRGDSAFCTWLYRMAINLSLDHLRAIRRHVADSLEDTDATSREKSAEQQVQERQTAQSVKRAVDALPRTQRIIVHQYYWLGFKTREIAEVLGCPENTVKVYLMRARKSLALDLEELPND